MSTFNKMQDSALYSLAEINVKLDNLLSYKPLWFLDPKEATYSAGATNSASGKNKVEATNSKTSRPSFNLFTGPGKFTSFAKLQLYIKIRS